MQGYRPGMRWIPGLLVMTLIFTACGKREEVESGQTRRLTDRDRNLVLDADNDARFGVGQPAPAPSMEAPPSPFVAGAVPESWSEAPASAFRLLNYRFGELGEVYLSVSRGGVLANVNRWLGQFGVKPVDEAGLAAMEVVEQLGHQGVWVSADGDFGGGMGKGAQKGWSLRGVVLDGPRGLLTVKMIGPTDEVKAQEAGLRQFVQNLSIAE